MTLEKFVDVINKQEEFEVDKVGPDKEARDLADVFLEYKDKTDEELSIIIYDKASKDNDIACAKIILNTKNKKNSGKYGYLQGDNLFAEVDIFKPYIDKDCKVLNQKWHVLISLLAFLDLSSFDEECKKDKKFNPYNIGKIIEIKFENKNLYVNGERKNKKYSSDGMTGFIQEAIRNGS